ncbi:MAG: hypothetical protein MI864_00310 [Pseudomonadales bacterium]|nr:hypothetical protein [Pseudomonadales bacterium]
MSIRVDTSPLISSSLIVGNSGHGVLAENIPSSGENGAGYTYNDLSLPADNGKEIRGEIVTEPVSGTFFAYEDTSFEFSANDGSYFFEYQLYVDGVATGSATRVDLIVGGGTDVSATLASIDVSTYQATVSLDVEINASHASITVEANPATIMVATAIDALPASIDVATYDALVQLGSNIAASHASISVSTYAAVVTQDLVIQADVAAIQVTSNAATVNYDINIQSELASVEVATYVATVTLGDNLFYVPKNIVSTTLDDRVIVLSAYSRIIEL